MIAAAQINETALCTLTLNPTTNSVELGYNPIEQHFTQTIHDLKSLCDDSSRSLEDIIAFIQSQPELDKLSGRYRYCQKLDGTYQAFDAKNEEMAARVAQQQALISAIAEQADDEDCDEDNSPEAKIAQFKSEISKQYELWAKAYSINLAYRYCHNNKDILTFSHRISGWANPVYRLTPNFTVELKTNFGFGNASYFYTKLTYKNIEITPVSEWIQYELAKFSEIVRYTRFHALEHDSWIEALTFCKSACNTSLVDEAAFVSKYIIEECEKMVTGLEEILVKDDFSIRKGRFMGKSPIDKKGHYLTEFRGEKISGALDFIDKILEFKSIASVTAFIGRIEDCCRRIQPILSHELIDIKGELTQLNAEMDTLAPTYLLLANSYRAYAKHRQAIVTAIVGDTRLISIDYPYQQISEEFAAKFPEYPAFEIEYNAVAKAHARLSQMIENMSKVFQSITKHNNKIRSYFGLQLSM